MYVLVDVEWVKDNDIEEMTQIAAIRVSDKWKTTASFSCLIRPGIPESVCWEHMAYSGYTPDEFMLGRTEEQAMRQLDIFLCEDDVICFWHEELQVYFMQIYKKILGVQMSNETICVIDYLQKFLDEKEISVRNAYRVAEMLGVEVLSPTHKSENDIRMMVQILSRLSDAFGSSILKYSYSQYVDDRIKSQHELINARMLGDYRINILKKNIVGYCHNMLHTGNMTKKILRAHDCEGKACPYLVSAD